MGLRGGVGVKGDAPLGEHAGLLDFSGDAGGQAADAQVDRAAVVLARDEDNHSLRVAADDENEVVGIDSDAKGEPAVVDVEKDVGVAGGDPNRQDQQEAERESATDGSHNSQG